MENFSWKSTVLRFEDQVEYAPGGVVSRQVLKTDCGNITLFAFDKGQGLSEHTAPFDALIQVLDGKLELQLAGVLLKLEAGQMVLMPAGAKHALHAAERFKMLLTMVKG